MVRDAMRFREQAKQADVAKKKVIKIGKKVLTPGAAQTKAEKSSNKMKPLRDALRKSGKIEDAAALLSQRLNR
jgi:dihydropteroate synthase